MRCSPCAFCRCAHDARSAPGAGPDALVPLARKRDAMPRSLLGADEAFRRQKPHRAGGRPAQDAAIVVILVLLVSLVSMADRRAKSSLLSERASPTSRATT